MNTKIIYFLIISIFLFSSCVTKKDLENLKREIKGLRIDDDDDAVPNIFDKSPSTPTKSKVYGDGTEVDSDSDGIPDYIDKELFSPKGAIVDTLGVAKDNDNDGVPDEIDKQPDTPPHQLVNFQGVAITSFKPDSSLYVKPVITQPIANNIGETSVDFSKTNTTVGLPIILFNYSFEIEDFAYPDIIYVYNFLKTNPNVKLKVIGHTDNIDSDESNMQLGMHRAQAVIKVLTALGIDEKRLIAESKGESQPKIDPINLSLNKFNRRVEFEILK